MANKQKKDSGKNQKRNSKRKPYYKNVEKVTANDVIKSLATNGIKHNEPEWFIYDETMFEGVISMPTMEFKGQEIPMIASDIASTISWKPSGVFRIPDVLAYRMNPSVGRALGGNAPINIISRKNYAEWTASNAKTKDYAPEDISMCVLSIGQLLAMINFVKRAYGILQYFNFYNKSVPRALFAAMGLDYDNWSQNMADVRTRINQLIARIDTIQFPTALNYFKTSSYVYENVFVDRDDKMISYHLMTPDTTWMINETASPDGTILETIPVAGSDGTYQTICRIISDMIDAIIYSATFNAIFADIINLTNRNMLASEVITVEMLPIDYVVTPLYSEGFNWQVMNMSIVGSPKLESEAGSTPSNNVITDTNKSSVIYDPHFSALQDRDKHPIPVRIPDTTVSDKEFVELLAYYNVPRVEGNGQLTYVCYPSLSHYYCTGAYAVRGGDSNNVVSITSNFGSTTSTQSFQNAAATLGQLVHAPFYALYSGTGENAIYSAISKIGSFTQIPAKAMANLRYQVFLALFKLR